MNIFVKCLAIIIIIIVLLLFVTNNTKRSKVHFDNRVKVRYFDKETREVLNDSYCSISNDAKT